MPVEDGHELSPDDLGEYVPAIFAETAEEADWYRQLLEDHNISAMVDEDYAGPPPDGVLGPLTGTPVLVREALTEEAKEVIAEIDDIDDLAAYAVDDDADDEDELGIGFDGEDQDPDVIGDDDEEEDQ